MEKGREEGLEQGLKKGIRQTAGNLKKMGFAAEDIIKATGLTIEEIINYKSGLLKKDDYCVGATAGKECNNC